MAIYDPKSMKADEFINNEEIIETIAYAEANKDNIELIDELLATRRQVRIYKDGTLQPLRKKAEAV